MTRTQLLITGILAVIAATCRRPGVESTNEHALPPFAANADGARVDPPAPATKSAPRLALRLSVKDAAKPVLPGTAPELAARLANEGTEPVTLVLPGDGSEIGWRTPVLRWAVAAEDSSAPLEFRPNNDRTCGNINAPDLREVFTLAPGEDRDLGVWIFSPSIRERGRYRVALEYENIPRLELKGETSRGKDLEQVLAAFAATTACVVRSEPILIVVN